QINKIFKLSAEFDIPGEHDFDIYFSKDLPTDIFYENPLKVKSFKAPDRTPPIRIVTGKSREAGKGNIPIPVIYLGLSRLFPLGESNLEKKEVILTKKEEKFLYDNYEKILLSYEEEYRNINQISKNNIKTLGISTNNYDWQAISAGQDNVGKIICTILEFQRLKENFKDNYIGGILLIDEIESTLYPKAQQELIKFLNKQCQDLKLKVICTTHSLEIIKECMENESLRYHTIINFLDKTHGKLICKNLSTFEDISRNLLVLPRNNKKENLLKIKIFTEDSEGEWLLKKIIKKEYEEYIDIVSLGLGFDEIAKIAYKLSEIKEGIVIYDADVEKRYTNSKNSSDFKRNMNKSESYLFFPGKNSIEEDFLEILKNISKNEDKFWNKCNNDSRQLALSTLEEYKLEDRNDRKKWFNNERKNYGEDGYVILEKWKEIYKKSID
ncbi:AAA family ATPase, partial [Fusobacterium simiae]